MDKPVAVDYTKIVSNSLHKYQNRPSTAAINEMIAQLSNWKITFTFKLPNYFFLHWSVSSAQEDAGGREGVKAWPLRGPTFLFGSVREI